MASPELQFAIDHFDITSSLPLDPRRRGYTRARVHHAYGQPLDIVFPAQEPEDDLLVFPQDQRLIVPPGAENSPFITLSKGVHRQAMNILVAHGLPVRLLDENPSEEALRELSKDSIALGFRTYVHDLLGSSSQPILSHLTAFAVRAGIGVTDDVTNAFTDNSSVIERTPGPNRFAVATWTFHKIVEVLRKIPFHLMRREMNNLSQRVQQGDTDMPVSLIAAKAKWSIREYDKPLEWHGNGVGIVGVGGIGGYLTELLLQEGSTVVTHDRNESKTVRGAHDVSSLEDLISDDRVRVISLHVSGEDPVWKPEHTQLLRTKHHELKSQGILKKWVLINTSRGRVIEREHDIEELVNEGILELAVLDVYQHEHDWYREDLYYRMLGDSTRYDLSPHALGSSIESDVGNAQDLAYSILSFLIYGGMDHAMNAPRFPLIDDLLDRGRAQVVLLNILHHNHERVISGAKQRLGSHLEQYNLRESVENSTLRRRPRGNGASMYSAEITLHQNGSGAIDSISPEILNEIVQVLTAAPEVMRAWATEITR